MKRLCSCLLFSAMVFGLMPGMAQAQSRPGLVFLPVQGEGLTHADRDFYRGAIVQSLAARYQVFSGNDVDKKLEKFAKKTCDDEKCLQEMAIAYQASLMGRAVINKDGNGYLVLVELRDVISDKVEFSDTRSCRSCDKGQVIDLLKTLGAQAATVAAAPVATQPATPPQPVRVTPVDDQTALWEAVKEGNTADDYDAYLSQYPKGKFAALAKSRKAKLDKEAQEAKAQAAEEERQAKAQAEQDAWKAAEANPTPESYGAYLESYPAGKFAQLAGTRQTKLQDDQVFQKEKSAWNAAQASGTLEGLDGYLKAYPTGRYAADAEARRKALVEEAALREEQATWQAAEKSNDKAQVQSYLNRYPGGRFAAQAHIKLAAIQKEEAEMRPGKVYKDCADCPEMVIIPEGSFDMGSSDGDVKETPVHPVSVPMFALGKHEVTQAQWRAVIGSNPSNFKNCDDCPVEQVSWDDTQSFLQKLNAKTGKQYRLPTEAEWEYSCRSGGDHTYCGSSDYNAVAWIDANSQGKTNPVGRKQANAFGLYDMSGNVWEWVGDCWNRNYYGSPSDSAAWTSGECGMRVVRSGSWASGPRLARSTNRWRFSSGDSAKFVGFRVASPVARTN